jgi:hypothetical protein
VGCLPTLSVPEDRIVSNGMKRVEGSGRDQIKTIVFRNVPSCGLVEIISGREEVSALIFYRD